MTSYLNLFKNKGEIDINKNEAMELIYAYETDEYISAASSYLNTHLFWRGLHVEFIDSNNDNVEFVNNEDTQDLDETQNEDEYKTDELSNDDETNKENKEDKEEEEEKPSKPPKKTKKTKQTTKKSLFKEQKKDELFQYVVSNDWIFFTMKMEDHFNALGYAVLGVNLEIIEVGDKKFEVPIPIVLDRDTYDITVIRNDKNQPEYKIYTGGDKVHARDDLYILFSPNREPNAATGTHRSIISKLLPLYRDHQDLKRDYKAATKNLCEGRYLIEEETGLKDATPNTLDSLHFDYIQRKTIDVPNKVHENPYVNSSKNDLDDPSKNDSRFVYIPPGYKLSASGNQKPEPPKEFLLLCDKYRGDVYAQLQIPDTLVYSQINSKLGTSSNVDLGDDNAQKLSRAIQHHQTILYKALKDIYEIIFGNSLGIEFRLDVYNPINMYTAALLEDLDFISREESQKLILQSCAMPTNKMFTGKNPHHRPRPGQGSENQVDSMITARVNNINAESVKFKADVQVSEANTKKLEAEAVSIRRGDNKKQKTG